MTLDGRQLSPTLLGSGAFAHVFDMRDGTVVKAYYRQRHASRPIDDWTDPDRITRLLWRTEAEAYERLQSLEDLRPFVPKFYGRVDPHALGLPQYLPRGPHLPECGLRLEKITGEDRKLAHLERQLQQKAEVVLEKIRDSCGRLDVWDASCFCPGSCADFTLIDFAVSDDYGEVCEILDRRGALPQQTLRLLRLD